MQCVDLDCFDLKLPCWHPSRLIGCPATALAAALNGAAVTPSTGFAPCATQQRAGGKRGRGLRSSCRQDVHTVCSSRALLMM